MTHKKTTSSQGIALLIAVVTVSASMAIALGIAFIIFTELRINRSAAQSFGAFYAADIARECALYYMEGNADTSGSRNNYFDPFNHVLMVHVIVKLIVLDNHLM